MSDATNSPAIVASVDERQDTLDGIVIPTLARSVSKRGYELGRSPDLRVPAFMFLGLPAIAFAGALIGIMVTELAARL